MSDLVVRSVAELSAQRGYGGSAGLGGDMGQADVALVEISDRPKASVGPMVARLRSLGIPVAIRIHRSFGAGGAAAGDAEMPLGGPLEAAIDGADVAFFGGRGELVRIASEVSVTAAKARLIPSPVYLPAELGSSHDGGVIGIGFAEGCLPGGVREIESVADLRLEVMACQAVALGPLMGPGYPAFTHGLIARGIGVVAPTAQAALDGYPPPGWTPISHGADQDEWEGAIKGRRTLRPSRAPRSDGRADRWFECLEELAGRELLTQGT